MPLTQKKRLFYFCAALAMQLIFSSTASAIYERSFDSREAANQFILDEREHRYFPVAIKGTRDLGRRIQVWDIRVVPFPSNSGFEFKWLIQASEAEYLRAVSEYSDYTLIYMQKDVFSGVFYNAIWVKNALVFHEINEFDNALVVELPYSLKRVDLPENLAFAIMDSVGLNIWTFIDLGLEYGTKYLIKKSLGTVVSGALFIKDCLFLTWNIYKEISYANNPVYLIPFADDVKQNGYEVKGKACAGGNIIGAILLDLADRNTADIHPTDLSELTLATYYDNMESFDTNRYTIRKDVITVLRIDEIRRLTPERCYYIVPKSTVKAPAKTDPQFYRGANYFNMKATTGSYGSFSRIDFGKCPTLDAGTTFLLTVDTSSDAATYPNRVIGPPINVGNYPFSVIAKQTGDFVYVGNQGSSSFSVINSLTDQIEHRFNYTRGQPRSLAISGNGQRVYVLTVDGNLGYFETLGYWISEDSINTGIGARQVWVGVNDGYQKFTTHSTSNVVKYFQGNSLTRTISVGQSPEGMAFDSNGTRPLYVANSGSNSISKIRTDNYTVDGPPISVGSGPYSLVITPDSRYLYVTNNGDNTVQAVNLSNRTVSATINVGRSPLGMAITPNGEYVYVANGSSNTVSIISTNTNTVVDTITVGSYPYGICILPNGSKAYITNRGDNNVTVLGMY